MKRKKIIKSIGMSLGAMAVLAIAIFLIWWYGGFLPGWIRWKEETFSFGETIVTLKNRRLTVRDGEGALLWKTESDWFVQDLVVMDIDRDGEDEMILLVWKHGSYGDHMPFWVEKNDKALKQHIFIYHQEPKREAKLRPLWMSSQILYEITEISPETDSFLSVTDRTGNTRVWAWEGFGLKLVR